MLNEPFKVRYMEGSLMPLWTSWLQSDKNSLYSNYRRVQNDPFGHVVTSFTGSIVWHETKKKASLLLSFFWARYFLLWLFIIMLLIRMKVL
jgi:hypothetical protein